MNIKSLLGGLTQSQPDQFQSLLGEYYDPRTAKMKWLGGTLQGLGLGLASGQPGAWATGLTQGGGQAIDDYRKQAMQGYAMGQQADDRAYGREQDQKNWDYRAAQDAESKRRWEEGQALAKQRLAMDQSGSGPVSMGMTPIPLRDDAGNWTVGQLSPNGGVTVNGQPAGSQWKFDPYALNADKSKGTTMGKGQGEVQLSANSLESKLPGLDEVITELDGLANDATYSMIGQGFDFLAKESGLGPTSGAVARTKYEAMVNNQILPLLRDTFGSQFTATEGESLKKTLGDPNKTPPEKQAVLRAFIDQKRRDLAALQAQTGQSVNSVPKTNRMRFNPETGELE